MFVIIIRQADLSRKVLGPIDCNLDEAHRIAERLRIRAIQLSVSSFTTEVAEIEKFDGGNLSKALGGFYATRPIAESDFESDEV